MSRVLISGFYGFNNAGDEAILKSMISEFKKLNSDVSIVVLSADPANTSKSHGVGAVDRSSLFKVWKALRDSDALISGGGGLLQDATSLLSMWYYSGIILLAFFLKKPVYAFAQGIGPVVNRINKYLLKCIMNKVDGVSVRDQRSLIELKKLGVSREVCCTIDPAFLIDPISKDQSTAILIKECKGLNMANPKIGFSIRSWKGDLDISLLIAQAADRIRREIGADIVFFPLHYKKDLQLAKEISQKMDEPSFVIQGEYSTEQLVGLYGLMDVNVCVRFHGLIFSIMQNVPIVPISYDPKVDSLIESMDLEPALKYSSISADDIFNETIDKWKKRDEIKYRIMEKNIEFRQTAQEGVNKVTDWLKTLENNNTKKSMRKNQSIY